MSDFNEIQTLIRLKRHEQPTPDFVEDFLTSFKERQRGELLNHSARGLLWERVNTYFEGLFAPKWALAGATAVALLGAFVVMRPVTPAQGGFAQMSDSYDDNHFRADPRLLAPISDEEVQRYLISRHYQGGLTDPDATLISARDPRMDLMLPSFPMDGNLLPAGFKLDME